jgi:hypothetical protein
MAVARNKDREENLAERQGFEPWVPSRARRISSAVLSTTQPPLRKTKRALVEARIEPARLQERGHYRMFFALPSGFAQ